MRFAEIFLRLGLSLVTWMIVYAYFLWLAVLHLTGCATDGPELYRVLLGVAPFAAGTSLLLRATRPLHEVHRILRWLGIPLALLLPFVLRNVVDVLLRVTTGTDRLCETEASAVWHAWWAPLQLAALAVVIFMIVGVWRSVAEDSRNGASS